MYSVDLYMSFLGTVTYLNELTPLQVLPRNVHLVYPLN